MYLVGCVGASGGDLLSQARALVPRAKHRPKPMLVLGCCGSSRFRSATFARRRGGHSNGRASPTARSLASKASTGSRHGSQASGRTVPVLATPEGALGESEEILNWVDERTPLEQRLFPADPRERRAVARVCRRLDEVLGPRGRRLMYTHMLAQRDLMLRFNNQGVPAWEDRMMRVGWPLAVRYAQRELGIRPGVEVEDEASVFRELDFVAGLLDGRKHLCGDRSAPPT
jgi:hypothetical protein